MKMRIINKLKLKWAELFWHWKLIILGASSLFVIVSLIFVFFLHASQQERDLFVARESEVLGQMMDEKVRDVLLGNNSMFRGFDDVQNVPQASEVVVFDPSGRVIAPISRLGEKFGNRKFFNDILAKKVPAKFVNGNSIEILRPVTDERSPSFPALGLVYMKLEMPRPFGSNNALSLAILVLLIVVIFIYAIIKQTIADVARSSERTGQRYLFEAAIDKLMVQNKNEMSDRFDSDFRLLIHALPLPVIILDKQYRLMEMNSVALKKYHRSSVGEGVHVIDILNSDASFQSIVSRLGDFEKNSRDIMKVSENGISTLVFCLKGNGPDLKYALVFEGVQTFHPSTGSG